MFQRLLVPCALMAVMALGASDLYAGKSNKDSKKPKDPVVTQPIVQVLDVFVHQVVEVDGALVAQAEVTLDITGRIVIREVEIPLDLIGLPGMEDECDILSLSLGPVELDLLGLVVELDDCNDGPVTVDIFAVEGQGPLGDLLCSVAGALNDGMTLSEILGDMDDDDFELLTTGLADILDAVAGNLIGTGAAQQASASSHTNRCDILALAIPDGIQLSLLGLEVETSGICLDVYALSGRNNLLGDLLCSLTDALNRGRNTKGLVKRINKVIDRSLR